jgi:hypothetical protein
MLAKLLSSRTKAKIIALLYANPAQKLHMRNIERMINERINSVRSALLSLSKNGVCLSEKIGKKSFFQAAPGYVFYDELLRIVAKEKGLGARIIKEKLHLGKIKLAFLTAHYYKHHERTTEEIDLFLVGSVSMTEVAKLAKEEGDKLGVELNYSVMTSEEYEFRKKNKDPFLMKVLQQNRVVLCGKEE